MKVKILGKNYKVRENSIAWYTIIFFKILEYLVIAFGTIVALWATVSAIILFF